jgi:hypothetical protein
VVSKRHHILPLNLFLWPNNKHVQYSLAFPTSFGLKLTFIEHKTLLVILPKLLSKLHIWYTEMDNAIYQGRVITIQAVVSVVDFFIFS